MKAKKETHKLDSENSSPPTLPSVDVPVIVVEPSEAKPQGLKYDHGKVRTDLLPMRAIEAAAEAMHIHPVVCDEPWAILSDYLVRWKRATKGVESRMNMAVIVAALFVLLTRAVRGDVRIARLLPDCGPALFEVARVLTFGAQKYGPNNWQHLENFEARYYAAILRHVFASEKVDPESGLLHLAHAACNALFLLSAEVGHD